MGARSDIDRLIELGLNRYGAGDLDGAMLMWEEALAVDPDNAQASSYVDYVRLNYELLSSGEPELETDGGAPFAIEEEPEYHIEIQPGEERTSPRISSPIHMDPLDSGWFIEGEQTLDAGAPMMPELEPEPEPEPVMLELEADEPPVTMPQDLPAAAEFGDEHTGGFTNEGTPIGFGTQETEIRKRDFGFVQPVAAKSKAPTAVQDSPMSIGSAPTMDIVALDQTQEHEPFRGATDNSPSDDDDLINSLPSPRPAGSTPEHAQPSVGKVSTRDMPISPRPPASRDSSAHSQAEVMLSHTPTQDFELAKEPARIDISAPTRELGLRPSALSNPDDDDAPTGQSDVRAIRQAASRHDGGATQPGTESTRHDIVLPFDPIDARSAQILDDLDADAPPDEPEEDQTRRRITTLLERAIAWNEAADLDRAVTAVDLALSENPNSALGQKLITRNRDTIMQVFQAFLGDLERTPQMARPLHELANAPISPRAAFLLSRIDGTLTIDELLDVSGMPRLEAFRHLCQLFLRGILR